MALSILAYSNNFSLSLYLSSEHLKEEKIFYIFIICTICALYYTHLCLFKQQQ